MSPLLLRTLRRALLGGCLAVALSVTSLPFSVAFFTQQRQTEGNDFGTATVTVGRSPTSALLTATGMLPGDKIYGAVTISNSGTVPLRYAVTTSATNADGKDLAGVLRFVARSATADPCSWEGGAVVVPTSGTMLLKNAAIGDPAVGSQGGDRSLPVGASEQLCFSLELPASAATGYASGATTATFTFSAEQTANNP